MEPEFAFFRSLYDIAKLLSWTLDFEASMDRQLRAAVGGATNRHPREAQKVQRQAEIQGGLLSVRSVPW